ncbi:MAG: recombinase family protein [Solirubrobacterales bacterium]
MGDSCVTSRANQQRFCRPALCELAGCDKVFSERVSASSRNRPELERMLDQLRAGDRVVVWRIDRLGRSLRDLIDLVGSFEEDGVSFVSVQESIDTSSPGGRLIFHVFASLAEFESEFNRERTHAGLAAARSRGRLGGRPRAPSTSQVSAAKQLLELKSEDGRAVHTVTGVAAMMNVSRQPFTAPSIETPDGLDHPVAGFAIATADRRTNVKLRVD